MTQFMQFLNGGNNFDQIFRGGDTGSIKLGGKIYEPLVSATLFEIQEIYSL